MSLRTKEVADEASRFSLRNIFSHSFVESGPISNSPPTQLTSHPHIEKTTRSLDKIKFNLLHATTPKCNASIHDKKQLQANYITGGCQKTNQHEIMRLNGIITDMKMRLSGYSDRICTAEHSVARGNRALKLERATAHARMVALASEIRNAHSREETMRTQIENVPIVANQNRVKFEKQECCAVALQKHVDEQKKLVKELDEKVNTLTKHEESTTYKLNQNLENATSQLKLIQSKHDCIPDTRLKRETEQTVCPLDALNDASEPVAGVNAQQQDASITKQLIQQLNEEIKRLFQQKDEENIKIKRLLQQLDTEMELTANANKLSDELREEIVSLKKKTENQTMLSTDVHADVVNEFKQYSDMKHAADEAAEALESAGKSATKRLIDNAFHTHASAKSAYWRMVNNEPMHSGTMSYAVISQACVEKQSNIDVHALQMQMETKMIANSFTMGVGCVSSVDNSVDFHDVPLVVCTAACGAAHSVTMKPNTENGAYVTAVTGDIFNGLDKKADEWRHAGSVPLTTK